MPKLTRRRSTDARGECWHVYYGDVHAGTIAIRSGIEVAPHNAGFPLPLSAPSVAAALGAMCVWAAWPNRGTGEAGARRVLPCAEQRAPPHVRFAWRKAGSAGVRCPI